MNVILLSGGSGTRLWPLSNGVRSKQFLKLFRRTDGVRESMIQRMYRMLREIDPNAVVTIATSGEQIFALREELGDQVLVSAEPCRRDTFPAIVLSSAWLHDVRGVGDEEAVVVCPIDSYVAPDYVEMLRLLHAQAETGTAKLVLMGIEPDGPSEKYGYILPRTSDPVSEVDSFCEKPDMRTAQSLLRRGALWNAGVFAFRLKDVLEIAQREFGTARYQDIYDRYGTLPKISFDYAVVEREPSVQVMRYAGHWKDIGTWNALTEVMSETEVGNVIAEDCRNTHIINELQIPLIALGAEDLAIAATPDGILVADKEHSEQLKHCVPDRRPMYERRPWGEYRVLDFRTLADGSQVLTKQLVIRSGKHISYQTHRRRTEVWTVVEGSGTLILDGAVQRVGPGDCVRIAQGVRHGIRADEELYIIEVQLGTELVESDVERLDWDWDW